MSTPVTLSQAVQSSNKIDNPYLLKASLSLPKLLKDSKFKPKGMFKTSASLRQNKSVQNQQCTETRHCLKCFLARRFWMVSVNMYDIMGLLDICPCGTLHSVRPYISYKV